MLSFLQAQSNLELKKSGIVKKNYWEKKTAQGFFFEDTKLL